MGDVHQAHHHASRYIYERFPRSRTMTSHGSALLSLLYVHSQANLTNTYFDHTNIIMYDISRIKIPWLRSFAVGTNSKIQQTESSESVNFIEKIGALPFIAFSPQKFL